MNLPAVTHPTAHAADPLHPPPASVAVIGVGFSGAAVFHHLARRLPPGSRVLLLERGSSWARGAAYSTPCASHWLNVPAGRLGLDPADEAGFIRWLQARHPGHQPAHFVPRALLGDYLADDLADSRAVARERGVLVEQYAAQVVDLQNVSGPGSAGATAPTPAPDLAPSHWLLRLDDGSLLPAQQVVLATGHLPPAAPSLVGEAWGSPGLWADPWATPELDALPDDAELLVLGSGLTAVDVVIALHDRGHHGRITLLSRRGLLPQPHRLLEAKPAPGVPAAQVLAGVQGLRPLLRAVREWVARSNAQGHDWRDVMASLRPHTVALWQSLSLRDRRQFLRHLQPWWDTHRHRMAPGIHRRLVAELESGRVVALPGQVHRVQRLPDGRLRVSWRPRGGRGLVHRDVHAVLNCTGASTQLKRAVDPLLFRLRERQVLNPDPLALGLLVDAQRRPLNAQGQPAAGLFYLGPMLKAQWWEAVAVPELRVHAREVAQAVAAQAVATGASVAQALAPATQVAHTDHPPTGFSAAA